MFDCALRLLRHTYRLCNLCVDSLLCTCRRIDLHLPAPRTRCRATVPHVGYPVVPILSCSFGWLIFETIRSNPARSGIGLFDSSGVPVYWIIQPAEACCPTTQEVEIVGLISARHLNY